MWFLFLLCPGNCPALTSYICTIPTSSCLPNVQRFAKYCTSTVGWVNFSECKKQSVSTSTVGWVNFSEGKKQSVGVGKCQKEPKLILGKIATAK